MHIEQGKPCCFHVVKSTVVVAGRSCVAYNFYFVTLFVFLGLLVKICAQQSSGIHFWALCVVRAPKTSQKAARGVATRVKWHDQDYNCCNMPVGGRAYKLRHFATSRISLIYLFSATYRMEPVAITMKEQSIVCTCFLRENQRQKQRVPLKWKAQIRARAADNFRQFE